MQPDLAHLEALVAVVDTGSFDAAAAQLHVTPSAISQRIKALERSTGRVLVRRSRPIEVTEAGAVYLRLARQVGVLVAQTAADVIEAGGEDHAVVTVPLAVNADSLDTWVLPALAAVSDRVAFDLYRDDQSRTAALLRDGTVMAAVTDDATPVQGCRSSPLGAMTYRPMASPDFVDRWFESGPDAASLSHAPVVVFDRHDDLQDDFLRARGCRTSPPRHHVPASRSFVDALLLGLGWGMLPDLQATEHVASGRLVLLDPDFHAEVRLHWQQWSLSTPALDAVASAIGSAAATVLSRVV